MGHSRHPSNCALKTVIINTQSTAYMASCLLADDSRFCRREQTHWLKIQWGASSCKLECVRNGCNYIWAVTVRREDLLSRAAWAKVRIEEAR